MSASGVLRPAWDFGDGRTRLPQTASPSSRPTPFDSMCLPRGSSAQGTARFSLQCSDRAARRERHHRSWRWGHGRLPARRLRCCVGPTRPLAPSMQHVRGAVEGGPRMPRHSPGARGPMTERVSAVKLLPLDSAERIELVAGWLGNYENYKWLDFGNGV